MSIKNKNLYLDYRDLNVYYLGLIYYCVNREKLMVGDWICIDSF